MTKQKLTTAQATELEKVQQLFADWRESKIGRARIPDSLWRSAADLFHTQDISINKIAKGLRLNHTALKEKIIDIPPAALETSADDDSALFLEVPTMQTCSDCVIEMENQSGIKLRMCFRGRADPSAINLGRYFLENNP